MRFITVHLKNGHAIEVNPIQIRYLLVTKQGETKIAFSSDDRRRTGDWLEITETIGEVKILISLRWWHFIKRFQNRNRKR